MSVRTKLMGHQQLILDFAKDKPYIGMFAGFGTGKTLASLAYIEQEKIYKILVISTKTAISSTWVDEIRQHTDYKCAMLLGTRDQKISKLYMGLRICNISSGYYNAKSKSPVLFLLNFDGIKNIYDELIKIQWDLIIIDESIKIKDANTLRTKIICSLGQSAERRMILTGFPVSEKLGDLYAQIKFLDQGKSFGKSYFGFLNKYFVKNGVMYTPKRQSVKDILELIKPFCIRVTNDVLKLPPKVYRKVDVELTEQQTKLLRELNDYFSIEFKKVKYDTEYLFALINKSLQICNGFIQDAEGNLASMKTNKDEVLIDILDEIDISSNKVIIWAIHRFTISKLENMFKKIGINALSLTGDTKNEKVVIDTFMRSKKCNILLTSQKKSSASITLTNCQYSIYYSNSWSGDERENSEARICRKGSEKWDSIFYIDLTCKGTIDEKVHQCLRKKKSLIDTLKEQFNELKHTKQNEGI